MKRVLMMILSIAVVFSLGLFANAYAGSSQVQNGEGQATLGITTQPSYHPLIRPGSTTPPSGGFGYYGARYFAPPQEQKQAQYGQAPCFSEEGMQQAITTQPLPAYHPRLRAGSTTPPSGGFGYYGAGGTQMTNGQVPEAQAQAKYGQAPCFSEAGMQQAITTQPLPAYHPRSRAGSTTPPSGGFGYYGAGETQK
jgi:hypothetical protein